MSSGLYDKLSEERKKMQEDGDMPSFWSTGSWQLFKNKYLYQANTPREQYTRIAKTLSAHTPDPDYWCERFFDLMWKGWLSPSTPILANTGTNRGLVVSCAGQYISDNIFDIYSAKTETAMLTKMGFGTAGYLGDIRPRGAPISTGGTATGVLPIIEGFQKDMEYVAQGTARRGSWAGYLPIDHGDFDEVCTYLEQQPDGNNIGWCVSNAFIEKLLARDPEALRRYAKALKTKCTSGKGYFFFPDKANAKRPPWYVDKDLDIKSPQLCNEIMLHSSADYTYTCVLASINLLHWDEIKESNAIFEATVFLDCVCQEFIERAKNIKGLEKAVAATKKGRALGLGVCGYASYLQSKRIPFESLEAYYWNIEVFSKMKEDSTKASEWIATIYGEPEWLKGYGRANSHLCVTRDTLLTTNKGLLTIGEVLDENITVWNGYEWSNVTPYKTGENREIFKVTLSNGRYLNCTKDHLWMIATPERSNQVPGGFVQVKVPTASLRIGDCIPKTLGSVIDDPSLPELSHAYTSGAFCGDGSISNSRAGKYPRNEMRLYGVKVKIKDKLAWKSTDTWPIIISDGNEIGVRGYLVDDLLPKYVVPINYSLNSRLSWLAGLIDTDGCTTRHGISISTSIESLADGIMSLLQTVGCFGHKALCNRTGGYDNEDDAYWTVSISQMECATLQQLGMVLYRCTLPGGVENTITKLSSKQFVKVVGVESIGVQDTYCLTEPKNGTCMFNGVYTAQCAIAPTKSTALIMGGVSEGINPDTAMVFTQRSAGGEVDRINPWLLELMKEKGVYSQKNVSEVREAMGSVQGVSWLTDEEKSWFKTAFEINQHVIIRKAAARGKYIDQWQSLNNFFRAGEDESVVNEVHKEAFLNPDILGMYYIYSMSGIQASNDKNECVACQ